MQTLNFCQSCGMPITSEELKGTNSDGSSNSEFCTYCYQGGAYTQDCTMDEMIEFCVKPMCEYGGMSEAEARTQMQGFFPQLKRWA